MIVLCAQCIVDASLGRLVVEMDDGSLVRVAPTDLYVVDEWSGLLVEAVHFHRVRVQQQGLPNMRADVEAVTFAGGSALCGPHAADLS